MYPWLFCSITSRGDISNNNYIWRQISQGLVRGLCTFEYILWVFAISRKRAQPCQIWAKIAIRNTPIRYCPIVRTFWPLFLILLGDCWPYMDKIMTYFSAQFWAPKTPLFRVIVLNWKWNPFCHLTNLVFLNICLSNYFLGLLFQIGFRTPEIYQSYG